MWPVFYDTVYYYAVGYSILVGVVVVVAVGVAVAVPLVVVVVFFAIDRNSDLFCRNDCCPFYYIYFSFNLLDLGSASVFCTTRQSNHFVSLPRTNVCLCAHDSAAAIFV